MRSKPLPDKRLLAAAWVLALSGCDGTDRAQIDDSSPEYRPTSLYEAVLVGNATTVEEFLAQGADVNSTEPDGTTLLMRAIHGRTPAIALRLIEAGADVSAANRYGVSPLYLAARNGDAVTARALLAAGADANSSLPEGETALMTAARAGSVEIVRALLGTSSDSPPLLGVGVGADIATPGVATSGYSAAAATPTGGAAAAADPNAKEGWYGQTALMWAAAEGHADVARALIEGGADLNAVDAEGANALIHATLNGYLDVAGLLLDAGADPRIADRYGRTVLFVAVDLSTIDTSLRPAPAIPSTLAPVDIVKMALARGADPDAALEARLPSHLAQGAEHDPILNKGATPFLRAAMSADLAIMRLLLDAGADPLAATAEREPIELGGVERPSSGGTTPLMAAAGVGWHESIGRGRESDTLEALQLLLGHGADVNAANQAGDSALHGATLRGSTAIIQFLVDHGANVHAKNAKGHTALDIARGLPDERIPYNEATTRLLSRLSQRS